VNIWRRCSVDGCQRCSLYMSWSASYDTGFQSVSQTLLMNY